jgi:hypothetical protein
VTWTSLDPTLPARPRDRLAVWIARVLLAAIDRRAEAGGFRMWSRESAAAWCFVNSLPMWMQAERTAAVFAREEAEP